MSTETIREFLVSLGFKVDSSGERRFTDGVKNVSKEVAALGAVAVATATAVLASVSKMANGLEDLYFVSQRTRASAENIKAIGFAADQMGSSAGAAQASIEAIAKFLRINPGGESLLKSWGIQTRDTNGELRDTTELLTDLGKVFRHMPYAQAYARANVLGIDEKTLQALIQGTDQFSDRYKQILARYGLDVTKATELSHNFNLQLRDLRANFEVLGTVVGTRVIGILNELEFRWNSLDDSTKSNINTVAEWVAGIVAGTAIIMGGPVAWIGALAAAIALLWDDYKTWKEGGKSLIDWGKWKPEIDLAKAGIDLIGDGLNNLWAIAKFAWPHIVEGWHDLTAAVKEAYEWVMKVVHAVEDSKSFKWVIDKTQGARDTVSGWFGSAADWISSKLPQGDSGKASADASAFGHAASQIWDQITGKPYDHGKPETTPAQGSDQTQPIGIRQNNPGNLRTGPGGSFGSYATPQDGLNALSNQLGLYFNGQSAAAGKKRLETVREIISTYAPKNENDTGAYVADVSGRLGVSPDAQLHLNDVAERAKLMQAIVLHENGRNPYSDAQYQQAAGANLSAQTTINVYGTTNPQETASAVGREQDSVNQRLVRNFQTSAAM
ncbi:hypothetical protein SAMN04487785_11323 [Dyella jiangningensis]|uniref:hypothetical protein n=1 Tax=Dyella sp. AtDHG13 TaxID=1938897 RepID=UPI00088ADFD5|nr:hypothetical protein [Dyella sp. AtDHG13]PXV60883.1 hypothetical protein BDW41_102614 [Dyella sp. AtDHG13]SDK94550.1 hypothetical protein SAMN04487785_11323 [Dyella jiangningensis]